jgi:hypothetical protein
VRAKTEQAASTERKKARAEELLALIARRKERMLEDFYDVGQALRELLDQKLYAALGHPSFEAMLEAHDVMGARQARKLVALVSAIPRAQALALGQEKAYALVAYTAATPEPDVAAELAKKDAKIGSKPISQASVRELQRATKAVHAKRAALRPKTPAALAAARAARDARASVLRAIRKLGIARPEVETTADRVVVRLSFAQAATLGKRR